MKFVIRKYLIVLLASFLTSQIVPAFQIENGIWGLLYSSLYLGILMFILRPIINLLLLPIHIITLNMTAWIAGIVIVALWTILSPHVTILPWKFAGIDLGVFAISPMNLSALMTIIVVSVMLIVIIHIFDWFVG